MLNILYSLFSILLSEKNLLAEDIVFGQERENSRRMSALVLIRHAVL